MGHVIGAKGKCFLCGANAAKSEIKAKGNRTFGVYKVA